MGKTLTAGFIVFELLKPNTSTAIGKICMHSIACKM